MKASFFISGLILVFSASLPAYAYTGKVFYDRNGNNVFDKGDKPLEKVLVSDGLNVVATGKDGIFAIPDRAGARFLSVTVPSGYRPADRYYKEISDENAVYDFALDRYDAGIGKDGSHCFIQITDTEISGTEGNERWSDDVRRIAEGEKAAFIVHTGDLCYEKGLKAHAELMNADNMGVPVYYCIGNHDLVRGDYGEQMFESIYGPTRYSFNVAGVHYIVLPMLGGDYVPGYTQDDVCRWLQNDLAYIPKDVPIVVFSHDLLTSGESFVYGSSDCYVDFDRYNLKAWIYGHMHTNYVRRQGSVLTVCSSPADKGGIDHSPASVRKFAVDRDGNLTPGLRYPYIRNKVTAAAPCGISADRNLIVNAYSSSLQTAAVTYTLIENGRQLAGPEHLSMGSDWAWTSEMDLERHKGKNLDIVVDVRFSDGSVVSDTSSFVYSPDCRVSTDNDWANLLGDASHTGRVHDFDGGLKLAWATNIGDNIFMTSPIVYGGRIYIASCDDTDTPEAGIFSLDPVSGKILWKYSTRGPVRNTIVAGCGNVFAQDVYGYLYAVDAVSGKLDWECRLGVNEGLPPVSDGLAIEDGIIYAGSGKGLSAFEASSGRILWKNEGWSQREGTTATLSVGDGVVLGSAQWMALYGNDSSTGKMLWSLSDSGMRYRAASPAIYGHFAYVISGRSFFILDAKSGKIVVRKELPYNLEATSTPVVSGGYIIFGTADSGLVALDAETLEEKWHFHTGPALLYTAPYTRPFCRTVETSPLVAGDKVYAAASDGILYEIDLKSGLQTWSYDIGAPLFSTPAISGNMLVLADYGGSIYAFISEEMQN